MTDRPPELPNGVTVDTRPDGKHVLTLHRVGMKVQFILDDREAADLGRLLQERGDKDRSGGGS